MSKNELRSACYSFEIRSTRFLAYI